MVVAAVGMMVLYFNSGAAVMRNPMFMFFPVMMLVSVLGSLAYGARGGNRTAEINADRRGYLQYIDVLDQSAVKNANAQHLALHWSHPEPGTLWALVGGRRMWERGPGDSDFCQVRLGLGAQRLSTRLVAPEVGTLDEFDPVTSMALRRFIRSRSMVANLPDRIGALPATRCHRQRRCGRRPRTIAGRHMSARGAARSSARSRGRGGRGRYRRRMGVAEMATTPPTSDGHRFRRDQREWCTEASARRRWHAYRRTRANHLIWQ